MSTQSARFPVQQMAILAVSRFAEPVASTSVYPYTPEMIASFNVPTDKIGAYSGWLSSVFSLSQCATGVIWGRASDKLGRKPMIITALSIIMVGSLLFGFSTSLAMAFTCRAIQGASSGNVGIIRTAVAEIVPQKELQPLAFSIMPLVWNVGSVFGPTIGGFLSNPQRRGWFTGSKLLEKYPFALPNLSISILFLIGIAAAFLFLRETHEDMKHRKDYGLLLGSLLTSSCSKRPKRRLWPDDDDDDQADPFLSEHGNVMIRPEATKSPLKPLAVKNSATWRDVFSRQSSINLVAYTGLAMHSIAFDQLIPVFMHHPVQSRTDPGVGLPLKFAGGFGLESSAIGVIFTVYGIFGMGVQFLAFPPIARRFGVLKCFKVCALTFPFVYAALPFTSLLQTSASRQGVCLALMLVKCASGIFAFPCSTILLTNSATSLSILGTLNGVSTSVSAAGRAAGPALVGWAFTLGVESGYGIVPWWTLCVVSLIAAVPVWWLIEMDGFDARAVPSDSNEESDEENGLGEEDQLESEATVFEAPALVVDGREEAVDLISDDIHDLAPVVSSADTRANHPLERTTSLMDE